MDIPAILKAIEIFQPGVFPRAALEEAIARREEITPELLRIVEEVAARPTEIFEQKPDYMAHEYAVFLLAQFREKRAHRAIVKMASYPEALPERLLGDTVTEDLNSILAGTCGGDMEPINGLILNPRAYEFARNAALESYLVLLGAGEIRRDEVMAFYRSLFASLERKPSYVWSGLVCACVDIYPGEVMDEIRQVFEEELMDPDSVDLELVEEALQAGMETTLTRFAHDHPSLITNAISEMEWWHCFQPDKKSRELAIDQPEIGRNDPCPCGSGKKYKKCCLKK